MRVPDEETRFVDGLQGPQCENLARDCGDFIVRRSDGLFGYQLAVVVDDALTGVDEVVRGRDILSATPRQIYLLRELGYPVPRYYHIPLLTDAQGRRLAKRDRDLDLSALSRRYTPQRLLGMLAHAAGLLEEDRPADLEEERRLLYVGMTRAREELILSAGGGPSPFLDSLPQGVAQEQAGRRQERRLEQLSLF